MLAARSHPHGATVRPYDGLPLGTDYSNCIFASIFLRHSLHHMEWLCMYSAHLAQPPVSCPPVLLRDEIMMLSSSISCLKAARFLPAAEVHRRSVDQQKGTRQRQSDRRQRARWHYNTGNINLQLHGLPYFFCHLAPLFHFVHIRNIRRCPHVTPP